MYSVWCKLVLPCVCTFILEIDSGNALVKMQIFEMFSAIALYSDEGHLLVLEALKHYKVYE